MPERSLPDARVRVVIDTRGQKEKLDAAEREQEQRMRRRDRAEVRQEERRERRQKTTSTSLVRDLRSRGVEGTIRSTAMRFGITGIIVAAVLDTLKMTPELLRVGREAAGEPVETITQPVQQALDMLARQLDALEATIVPLFTAAGQTGEMAKAQLLLGVGDPSVAEELPAQFAVLYEIASKYKRIELEQKRLIRSTMWGNVGEMINKAL